MLIDIIWGLGIGEWGLGIGPKSQSLTPNRHSPRFISLKNSNLSSTQNVNNLLNKKIHIQSNKKKITNIELKEKKKI